MTEQKDDIDGIVTMVILCIPAVQNKKYLMESPEILTMRILSQPEKITFEFMRLQIFLSTHYMSLISLPCLDFTE